MSYRLPVAIGGLGRLPSLRGSTVALLVVGVVCSLIAPRLMAADTAKPNIIFLLTDDQRWDTLGANGNTIIQTPHIDRLAERGVSFDNAFVTTAICMSNRACIFTGQYASRHGVHDFRTQFTPEQLAKTYPSLVKRAGYYTGFIGKWGVGRPPTDGFDYNEGWPGQNRYRQVRDGEPIHLTEMMGDQAIEFLETAPDDRPFLLAFSFKAPHCQDGAERQFPPDPKLESLYADVTIPPAPLSEASFFEALPEFLRTSENRRRWDVRFATPEMYQNTVKDYYRLITGVDIVVGRIVEALERQNRLENTVILFHGDHGFYLGERGFAGKWYAHEVSIRVPLIVFDPRLPDEQKGTRREQMALSIDLAPTIAELAGVPAPETMQGRSLVPIVEGETPAWRDEFFYEHLFQHGTIPRSRGVRTERWKYIRWIDSEPLHEELYDLANDHDEAHNLAVDPACAETLAAMRKKCDAWTEAVK